VGYEGHLIVDIIIGFFGDFRMNSKSALPLRPMFSALGATLTVGLSTIALAENLQDNPFSLRELSRGYMLAEAATEAPTRTADKTEEMKNNDNITGKDSEMKCGANMIGKDGEMKCGANMNMDEAGKAANPGADSKTMEGGCGEGMTMDMQGMIMNENKDKLPAGCTAISEDVKYTVHAGRKYAKDFPGTTFGFDIHEYNVKPCSRVTITFVNEDHIRHQWMMHGLPRYLYPTGMFHMEVNGPGEKTATLILPPDKKTYLVHCDIAQHMEKGMKAQMKVNGGNGDLPSIPGITGAAFPDTYVAHKAK
jgi:uncharacterized low-complexity protein